MTVHLVNLTNPMMMKGPVREIIPLGDQEMKIQLPPGIQPGRVHTLVSKTDPQHRVEGRSILLRVPVPGMHEVVAIDFA